MPMKKQNVPYTEDSRKETVRRANEEGVTAVDVAKELGLHVNQIYNWKNQFSRLTDK